MSLESSPTASPLRKSTKFEGSPSRLFLTALCASLGPFTFGFTIGYSSPAIPKLEQEKLLDGKSLTGWFGALMTVGAIFGGPCGGKLIEKYGRKQTLTIASGVFLVGWIMTGLASGIQSLLFGRTLCGFASGLVTVAAPVYFAEISTKTLRGFLGASMQLSITIGIVAAYAIGMTCSWSMLAFFGAMPAALAILLLFCIPETPRYLILKNRRKDALLALAALRGPHTDVEDECRDIEEGFMQESGSSFSYSEFKKPELSRPLFISVMIMVFQQFSGINAVMFYTVSIFQSAGYKNSELATVVIGIVQVLATLVACFLMDKMGRKKLLIIAGSIMALTCTTFGYYYFRIRSGTHADISWLAITSLVIYIIGFSLGWGPIPMLVMSELFPAPARGAASGIAMFTNWFCAFLITKEFILLQELFGQAGTFWIFGVCCLCGVMFVSKYLPETKGKSLEDIELYFLGRSMMM
ncbi:solute carrier family 2, facilitated glucose transporter member 8-like [Saccostrea echinata]|uniref:solute carrier family 2, facilitated glucose transporter member 8-like n=1 Tax=Saccostrea echinata TaxID=191078 RepID=UPI002A81D7E6|nr:solute carrier family 2, facilitated glucose transporter member 8-like [Saccostrea echinata]